MTHEASWLTDTDRELGRRHIAAGEAGSILIRRRREARIEDVWNACTDTNRLNREPRPEDGQLADETGQAWAALVEATHSSGRIDERFSREQT